MTKIIEYKNKKGQKLYKFQAYLGIDEQTGKKKVTRRGGFKSKREAELVLSRLQSSFEDHGAPQHNNILFKDVYEEWYESYINTVRVSTYARTRAMFNNHILPAFGEKRIRTITIRDVQKAVNLWFEIAPVSGYKRWYQYTTNVLDFAIRMGYIHHSNPAKAIVLPRRQELPGDAPENFYDREELATFFEHIDKQQEFDKYVLFRTLAYSGMRRGECLALTWGDVDLINHSIRINKTVTQGLRGVMIIQPPKTKAGYRDIPLDDQTTAVLKKWQIMQKEHFFSFRKKFEADKQLVFASTRNKHRSFNLPKKWYTEIVERTNLKHITIHGFRKTYCTALISAGLPIKEVQRRMGHDDIQTTLDVYSFVTKDQIRESTQLFEKYITG